MFIFDIVLLILAALRITRFVLIDSLGRLIHRHQGFDLRSHRLLESQVRRLVRA